MKSRTGALATINNRCKRKQPDQTERCKRKTIGNKMPCCRDRRTEQKTAPGKAKCGNAAQGRWMKNWRLVREYQLRKMSGTARRSAEHENQPRALSGPKILGKNLLTCCLNLLCYEATDPAYKYPQESRQENRNLVRGLDNWCRNRVWC
jgi:hypothetical protein